MEILNQPIVSVPIKALLILLLIGAILATLDSAKDDLANNKGWKGIVDEVILLAVEIGLIVVLIAMPLNAWMEPIVSILKFIINIILEFFKALPGILK